MLNKLAFAFSVLGTIFLAMLGGAGLVYVKAPGTTVVLEGFEAARAWSHRFREILAEAPEDLRKDDHYFIDGAEVHWNKGGAFEGYTLIAMRSSTNVYLLNMKGKVVHTWSIPFEAVWPQTPTHIHPLAKAKIFIERAEVFSNGDLIATYTGTGDTPYGYGLVKVDKTSKVIWKYSDNTHHSFYINKKSGEIFVLTQRFVDKPNGSRDDGLDYPILADYVVKLSSDGKVIDRISILDAFRNSSYFSLLKFLTRDEASRAWGRENWDLLHTNAVAELDEQQAGSFAQFKAGYILISLRRTSALAVIDPISRRVVWARQGMWRAQHATNFLANGHILFLDNLGYATRAAHFSRILEIEPETSEVVWQFEGGENRPFFTEIFGFLQRLPNGNTLVAESENSRILEVAPSGEVVWSYKQPAGIGKNGNDNALLSAPRYKAEEVPFITHDQ